jgi:nicotinamide riboside transporter PnuC
MLSLFDVVSWIASLSAILGAVMISLDLGRRVTGYGFLVMTASSVAWIGAGLLDDQAALTTQNFVLLGVNIVGIYRWLIRKSAPRAA